MSAANLARARPAYDVNVLEHGDDHRQPRPLTDGNRHALVHSTVLGQAVGGCRLWRYRATVPKARSSVTPRPGAPSPSRRSKSPTPCRACSSLIPRPGARSAPPLHPDSARATPCSSAPRASRTSTRPRRRSHPSGLAARRRLPQSEATLHVHHQVPHVVARPESRTRSPASWWPCAGDLPRSLSCFSSSWKGRRRFYQRPPGSTL
jgi:hypothetical protein